MSLFNCWPWGKTDGVKLSYNYLLSKARTRLHPSSSQMVVASQTGEQRICYSPEEGEMSPRHGQNANCLLMALFSVFNGGLVHLSNKVALRVMHPLNG